MSLLQTVGGIAAAGVVAVGGTALTGTGLTTTGTAAAAQFVGGTVSQSVTGASLHTVTYGYSDAPANTSVTLITLLFDGETVDGKHVAVTLSAGTPVAFTCGDIGAAVTGHGAVTKTSYCLPDAGDQVGLTSLAVTVS